MVDRITYGDKEPGDTFTADDADEIRTVINAFGTAVDADVGTAAGNLVALNDEGLIPAAVLPAGGGGDGSGDVVGPGGATDSVPALFDGMTGKVIKAGTAVQLLPTGTDGYWLSHASSAPTWVTTVSLASTLGALTSSDRIPYTGIHNLDASGAGALYLTAIDANLSPAASQYLRRNAADNAFEFASLGSAALLTAMPSGAPTSVSSSSGTVTLDFADEDFLTTTTTEAITTVVPTNLAAYSFGFWLVKQTTARNITFPAATIIFGNSGLLEYTGVANSRLFVTFYMDNTTLYAILGDTGVVGA
jgi:hypothetical protein